MPGSQAGYFFAHFQHTSTLETAKQQYNPSVQRSNIGTWTRREVCFSLQSYIFQFSHLCFQQRFSVYPFTLFSSFSLFSWSLHVHIRTLWEARNLWSQSRTAFFAHAGIGDRTWSSLSCLKFATGQSLLDWFCCDCWSCRVSSSMSSSRFHGSFVAFLHPHQWLLLW